MTKDFVSTNKPKEDPAVFRARFRRCHRLLHFIASRVLGSAEQADEAIQESWLKASWNAPRFEYEGAFRSWLVRVLINEALALRENKGNPQGELALRKDSFGVRNQLHRKRSGLLKQPQKENTENAYPAINGKNGRT